MEAADSAPRRRFPNDSPSHRSFFGSAYQGTRPQHFSPGGRFGARPTRASVASAPFELPEEGPGVASPPALSRRRGGSTQEERLTPIFVPM